MQLLNSSTTFPSQQKPQGLNCVFQTFKKEVVEFFNEKCVILLDFSYELHLISFCEISRCQSEKMRPETEKSQGECYKNKPGMVDQFNFPNIKIKVSIEAFK